MAENVLGPRTFSNAIQGSTSQAQGNVSPQGPSGGVSGGAPGLTELAPGGDFAGAAAVNQADMDAIWKMAEKVAEPKLRKLQAQRYWEGMSRVSRGATSKQIEDEKPWFMNLFGTTPYELGAASFDSASKASESLSSVEEQMDELKKLSPEEANARIFEIFDQNSKNLSGVAAVSFQQNFNSKLPQMMQVHQAENYKWQQEELGKAWLKNAETSLGLYNQLANRSSRDGTISEETLKAARDQARSALLKAPGQTDASYAAGIETALAISAQKGNLHAYRMFEESGATDGMTVTQRLEYEKQKMGAEKVAAAYYLADPKVQDRMAALNTARLSLPPEEWVRQAVAFDEQYKQATGATQGVMNIEAIGTKAGQALFEQRAAKKAAEAAKAIAAPRADLDAEIANYMVGNPEEIRGKAQGLIQRSEEMAELAITLGNLTPEKAYAEHETRRRQILDRAFTVGDKLAKEASEVRKSAEVEALKAEKLNNVQLALARGDAAALAIADQSLSKEEFATALSRQAQNIRQQVAVQAASKIPGLTPQTAATDRRVQLQQSVAVLNWVGRLITDSAGTPLPRTFIDTELMSGVAQDAYQRNGDSDSFNRVRPYLQAAKSDGTGKTASVLRQAWGDTQYKKLQEVSTRMDESPQTPVSDVWNPKNAELENPRSFPQSEKEIDSLFGKADVPMPKGISGADYRSRIITFAKESLKNGRAATPEEAMNVAKMEVDKTMSFAGDDITWPIAPTQRSLKDSLSRDGLVYDKDIAKRTILQVVRDDFPQELRKAAYSEIDSSNIRVTQGDENGASTTYMVTIMDPKSQFYNQNAYFTRSQLLKLYRENSKGPDWKSAGQRAGDTGTNPALFQGDQVPGMFTQ